MDSGKSNFKAILGCLNPHYTTFVLLTGQNFKRFHERFFWEKLVLWPQNYKNDASYLVRYFLFPETDKTNGSRRHMYWHVSSLLSTDI